MVDVAVDKAFPLITQANCCEELVILPICDWLTNNCKVDITTDIAVYSDSESELVVKDLVSSGPNSF